jgi:hypothetical protein
MSREICPFAQTRLMQAIVQGDGSATNRALADGACAHQVWPSPGCPTNEQEPYVAYAALGWAVHLGHTEIVAGLMRQGVNARQAYLPHGHTALHLAALKAGTSNGAASGMAAFVEICRLDPEAAHVPCHYNPSERRARMDKDCPPPRATPAQLLGEAYGVVRERLALEDVLLAVTDRCEGMSRGRL